ncbi:MAG TPA: hypothetical protein PKK12_15395, partial [Candidatus Aminicenantes bacterium]|nr:hypothetical protein [Candidatus Aminicenantes bacterium]
SSYYSGVANIYRYDFQSKEIEPLTNADTGFFRPLPLGDGNLLAFRYTATGFVPVLLREAPVTKVNAITFLGQRVVEERPLVKGWVPHPPSQVDLDREILYHGPYRPLKHLQLWSLVPTVEGYKDSLAFGLQVQLADAAIQHRVSATLGWSPEGGLAPDERLHFRLDYDYRDWRVSARWNPSDFYDLFGPTKTSRKGYSLGLQHRRHLLFDEPNRAIELLTRLNFYGGMENLPDFQNVATPVTSFATASVGLKGHNQYQSLGAIEDEKGTNWDLEAATYLADGEFFPRVSGAGARGLSLPQFHSSLWLRGAVGSAWGDRNQPFSRFYFGGFGNNWVDHRESKRFREPESFPGLGINEVPARTFARAQV